MSTIGSFDVDALCVPNHLPCEETVLAPGERCADCGGCEKFHQTPLPPRLIERGRGIEAHWLRVEPDKGG